MSKQAHTLWPFGATASRVFGPLLAIMLVLAPKSALAGSRLATSTPNLPDVLICIRDDYGNSNEYALTPVTSDIFGGVFEFPYSGDGFYYYGAPDAGFVSFDSSGTYQSSNGLYTNCENNISTLVANAQAYDLGSSPSPQPATSTASSTVQTVDNPNLDFALGVYLFLMVSWFVVWFFRTRNK